MHNVHNQVNVRKSHVTLSKMVEDGEELAVVLGFPTRPRPFKYPLTSKSIKHKDYDFLIADLLGILGCWSKKNLTYIGRLKLV